MSEGSLLSNPIHNAAIEKVGKALMLTRRTFLFFVYVSLSLELHGLPFSIYLLFFVLNKGWDMNS